MCRLPVGWQPFQTVNIGTHFAERGKSSRLPILYNDQQIPWNEKRGLRNKRKPIFNGLYYDYLLNLKNPIVVRPRPVQTPHLTRRDAASTLGYCVRSSGWFHPRAFISKIAALAADESGN
jgi:hypothetical protein